MPPPDDVGCTPDSVNVRYLKPPYVPPTGATLGYSRVIEIFCRLFDAYRTDSGVLAARETLVNHARKFSLEWEFSVVVIGAVVLAALLSAGRSPG